MDRNQRIEHAKKCALALWTAIDFGVGQARGLYVDGNALVAAAEVSDEITPLDDLRHSSSGHPLDYYAPSIWHAACFLTYQWITSRYSRSTFPPDDYTFESLFANRTVYRGQTRPWSIGPSSWRIQDDNLHKARALGTQIFLKYLSSLMTREDAIELELFGRIETLRDAEAVAQHYGFPTNLVDFTFDPRVALYFACGADESQFDYKNIPNECAVIYFTSFFKLCATGDFTLRFPPVQAQRLFHQSGFFVDYGERISEVSSVPGSRQSGMLVERNCWRIFFPRRYPHAEADEILQQPAMMQREPFFEELSNKIKILINNNLMTLNNGVKSLRANMQNRPPWRVKNLDRSFIHTDEEFVSMASWVERYIRIAALLQMTDQHIGDRPCLDPVIIMKIAELDGRGLTAIPDVTLLPGYSGERLIWIRERIREALECAYHFFSKVQ